MSYQHQFLDNSLIKLPFGKAVCVGRNYVEHAKELDNPVPCEPILFIKPASCALSFTPNFVIPKHLGDVHYEAEIAILIGNNLQGIITTEQAQQAVIAIAGALDLTLRDAQNILKKQGLPWEKAKCFDGALILTPFIKADNLDLTNLDIELLINKQTVQQGNSKQMITSIINLIKYITKHFCLQAGDVILTGTPAGVGKLKAGDQLQLNLVESQFYANVI